MSLIHRLRYSVPAVFKDCPSHVVRASLVTILCAACAPGPAAAPTPTEAPRPEVALTATAPPDTPTAPPSPTPPPPSSTPPPAPPTAAPARPEAALVPEAILILSPGPGSRLTSPLQVTGEADPTFEQSLVARLTLEDGEELALVPIQIAADVGQRGPFTATVPFTVTEPRQAFLQVYALSARDGGILHLASVGLTVARTGPTTLREIEPLPEQIVIERPAFGATVSGGRLTVAGIARASFEQTLIVELLDESGQTLAQVPLIVAAPDLGQAGPFTADLEYTIAVPQAGRLVVHDPSAAFAGDVHVASVELRLEP